MIVGILEEMELERLAEFANAVAVLTCQDVDPLRAQPMREEIEHLLKSSSGNKDRRQNNFLSANYVKYSRYAHIFTMHNWTENRL